MAEMVADPASGELKPVPDPTFLTTQNLLREIAGLREFVLGEIGHVREISQTKFAAMEAAFEDVASRTAEQKTDTKDALDAALQAAKDAVSLQTEASDKAIAKSEAATTKQIDSLSVLVDKAGQDTTDKINDLKARLDKLEASIQGTILAALTDSKEKKSGNMLQIAALGVSAFFVLVAIVSLMYTIATTSS
jgi:hypothetical protein